MISRNNSRSATSVAVFGVLIVVAIVVAIVVLGLVIAGVKSLQRYQIREDASNQVLVNSIIIRQQEQRVLIEQQNAQIRIEEARGIAEAQRIIDSSLTPQYLTYLAIQAQIEMSTNPNTTTIYIPAGPNGIPLVHDVGE